MAKKSAVNRNEMVRKLVKQFAARRKALKDTAENEALSLEERFSARLKLSKLPRNSAPGRIRNRCEVTGRPRAFYRDFGLCRMCFRKMAHGGLLPGVKKSSW